MKAVAALLISALPVVAEQVPAPEYFVTASMESSTAQALAVSCTTLSVDPIAMTRLSEDVLEQLGEDGFLPDNIAERMADPSGAIADLQSAFLARHDLADGAPEAQVCAAGRREIADGTGIGRLLVEVEG